jgi:SAM-dependent methyltransferase
MTHVVSLIGDDQVSDLYVPETRFGMWFLKSDIWEQHVLNRALKDLDRLILDRRECYPVIVDVGCGWGMAFRLLSERFKPQRMIGIDIEPGMIAAAAANVAGQGLQVEFHRSSGARLPLQDESVDMVFCHQTFHHLIDQHTALREFHRVLRPNGLLLFAESTRKYINSWIIRMLFRHPMEVQRSAAGYIGMILDAGFTVDSGSLSFPYLWWSRADLGLLERVFGVQPAPGHEETLVNLVAVRAH